MFELARPRFRLTRPGVCTENVIWPTNLLHLPHLGKAALLNGRVGSLRPGCWTTSLSKASTSTPDTEVSYCECVHTRRDSSGVHEDVSGIRDVIAQATQPQRSYIAPGSRNRIVRYCQHHRQDTTRYVSALAGVQMLRKFTRVSAARPMRSLHISSLHLFLVERNACAPCASYSSLTGSRDRRRRAQRANWPIASWCARCWDLEGSVRHRQRLAAAKLRGIVVAWRVIVVDRRPRPCVSPAWNGIAKVATIDAHVLRRIANVMIFPRKNGQG